MDINKYFEIVDYLENIQALENKSKSYSLETLHQGLQIESRSAIKHVMTEGKVNTVVPGKQCLSWTNSAM